MKLDVHVGAPSALDTPLLILPWCQGPDEMAERPTANLDPLDESLGLTLTRAVSGGDFRARSGETILLYRQGEEGPDRLLLVGVGDRSEISAEKLRVVGGLAAKAAGAMNLAEMVMGLAPGWLSGPVDLKAAVQAAVEGVVLGGWRFDELRSEPHGDNQRAPLSSLGILVPTAKSRENARTAAEVGYAVASSQNYARGLAVRPANIVTPRYLADEAKRTGAELGFKVSVMGPSAMEKDGMRALLAVAKGSDQEPRFIAMEYEGGKKKARPVVLVGKGVTFDSGGLSLKSPQNMESMKCDMSGAAAVLGAMRAIALLKVHANVVGLIPAVENLPSGHALKPGDVITSRSRKTIEVLNTDAEGRLILADALSYAARYEPAAMVDIATLTGACVIALGHEAIGLMGTDEDLIKEIRGAGDRSGERVWPLPLWPEYREQVKSDVADIKNTGGRPAATITAAMFLREFVGSVPWAHLDIAGTAWADKGKAYQPAGPTGVGVRLFTEWVRGRTG